MSALATDSLLAAGYGLFMAFAAIGLDVLARHSHRRADLYRTAGFSYLGHVDAWECPEGERLHRIETDVGLRLARYRARADVCNACPRKPDCTGSDAGREVTRALGPWPHSEAARFHRGIAVAMVAFGALVICAGAALNHGIADLLVLGTTLLICAAIGIYLLADLRSAPAGFPWPDGQLSGSAPPARPVDPFSAR